MQEGEVRTVYIHPFLGKKFSDNLFLNSLMTYKIEVIQADIKEKKFLFPKDKLISQNSEE